MAQVLICDSHAAVRAALSDRIAAACGLEVVTAVDAAADLFQALEEHPVDVLILEIMQPDTAGLELVRALSRRYPDLRIVIYTIYDEVLYAERSIRAGASAYVMKKQSTRDVIRAVRAVLEQALYVSDRIGVQIRRDLDVTDVTNVLHPTNVLSDQEMSVFQLMGHGRSIDAIAAELGASKKNIEELRSEMVKKLNLQSFESLVQYAGRIVHQ